MRASFERIPWVLALLAALALAGCAPDSDEAASAGEEATGACFASCGGGLSVCWSGTGITEAACQERARGMCSEPTVVYKPGCECPDEPTAGPEACP